jgi:glutamyl-tRNA synthetase
MAITHVIRGEDHISNTIKQLLLYSALGWKAPQFAHLPLIVNASGAPLSKRDGVTDIDRYRQDGYLPEAMLNYLVRLGWSHGDKEIFSIAEMTQLFTLGGVGKKAAVFDAHKLAWVNQQHIMRLTCDELMERLRGLGLIDNTPTTLGSSSEQARAYIELYKSRVTTLTELADSVRQLAAPPVIDHIPSDAPWLTPNTGRLLHQFLQEITSISDWEKPALLAAGRTVVQAADVGLALLGQPLRFAMVGSVSSPGIFDIMAIMGREQSMARITAFEELLRSHR